MARNKLLIKSGEIAIQIKFTNDEQKLNELKIQYDDILKQLKEFGVGLEDKTAQNPSYYFDKYDKSIQQFEKQGHPAQAADIHTDNVSPSNKVSVYLHIFQMHLTTIHVILLGILFEVLNFFL